MRFRFVPILVVVAFAAAAVFAAVNANPAQSFPSKAQACTSCHPGAPTGTSVSATPSVATPKAGATYTVSISLAGLTSSGDTGYWISNATGTPAVSVYAGVTGTNQTTYTQTMTAPTAPGTYSYTVWCDRGDKSTGQAKATSYTITVPPSVPTAAISSLTPNHGLTGSSVVIAGSNLGSGGSVRFGTTVAAATSWSATSVTATVPATLAPGAVNVTVTPTSGAASNALSYTVDAPPSGDDTTAPVTTAGGATDSGWYNHTLKIRLTATDNAGGSGVASITYIVDGGAPVTVAGASATATIQVARGGKGDADDDDEDNAAIVVSDGPHSVSYNATDVAGNVETAQTLTVNIDTGKPWTKAPRSAKVKRFHKVTLGYSVGDAEPNGGAAKVRIAVKNRRGDIVKVLDLGRKPVNTPLSATFTCKLRTGVYSFTVKATDLAGNTQATAATRSLTVYRGS